MTIIKLYMLVIWIMLSGWIAYAQEPTVVNDLPTDIVDAPDHDAVLFPNALIIGELTETKPRLRYLIAGQVGDTITVNLESQTSDFFPYVELYDSRESQRLRQAYLNFDGSSLRVPIIHPVETPDWFILVVASEPNTEPTGKFTITIENTDPSIYHLLPQQHMPAIRNAKIVLATDSVLPPNELYLIPLESSLTLSIEGFARVMTLDGTEVANGESINYVSPQVDWVMITTESPNVKFRVLDGNVVHPSFALLPLSAIATLTPIPSNTPPPSVTPTSTLTPLNITETQTILASITDTAAPTITATQIPTDVPTATFTLTPTSTATSTATHSPTATATMTLTPRPTATATTTASMTPKNTVLPPTNTASPSIAGVINAARLNVRNGPDADDYIVYRLSAGEQVRVIGRSNNDWVQIDVGIIGWVNSEFVNFNGQLSSVPVRKGGDPVPTPSVELNFRCDGALGPSFAIGDRFIVPAGDGATSVWDSPNKQPKMGDIPERDGGVIVAGPICTGGVNGNLVTWYVKADNGVVGYASEGYPNSIVPWLQPDG